MNNSVLISIGYPLGNLSNDENSYFIEKEGDIYSLGNIANYYIWRECMNVASYEFLQEEFANEFGDSVNLDDVLSKLIENKFILKLSIEDSLSNYEEVKNLVILRQGTGLGAVENNNKRYVDKFNRSIELEVLEYNLWMMCNGKNTVEEIINKFKEVMSVTEKDILNIVTSIIVLCGKGLACILR